MKPLPCSLLFALGILLSPLLGVASVNVSAYSSLQAAIDANPGHIIKLPPGEFTIDRALVVSADHTELHGPARIIQTHPGEPILQIRNARHVRILDLALSRSVGRQESTKPGLEVQKCEDVELRRVSVTDNHGNSSILAMFSKDVTVANCTVINYKGLTIDDRTKSDLYGYAFQAIDGAGIQMRYVEGVVIRDNLVTEKRLLPTVEIRNRHGLGRLTAVNDKPGRLAKPEMLSSRYTSNWHQGAAIHVTAPKTTKRVLITGNQVENAAQGIDMHADWVICSNNLISHCMIGLKAVHGSKHMMMEGNQITHVDLWGILLQPGTASRIAAPAEGNETAGGENIDGGSMIANNIISQFGFGEQYWNWAPRAKFTAMNLGAAPLPENPPLRSLLVIGNLVHDSGRDGVLVDGQWTQVDPRYLYCALLESDKPNAAQNVHFYGNLFDPGSKGVTDLP